MKVYGYCRISTNRQNIERQARNILKYNPKAEIIEEVYTGSSVQGRKEMDKLLKKVETGDTIIFDSVSRMSRDAEEGFALYQKLYDQGVNLEFLKEPHINTDVYRKALSAHVELTGDKVDFILEGVNKYLMELAREQIKLAFDQAQKELDDLHQRTKEGIETAKRHGKTIGHPVGSTYETKKAKAAKQIILKHSRAFGGSLTDRETMKLAGCCKTAYYKYKRQLLAKRESETTA